MTTFIRSHLTKHLWFVETLQVIPESDYSAGINIKENIWVPKKILGYPPTGVRPHLHFRH